MEPTRQSLTLGSLFDGIGGWQLAAVRNGIKPIWSSEIEPYPMAATKAHFPDTIQLGDITKLNGENLPPVDIICAGSPCQDLSVAGRQKGLQGERSGLFYQSIQLFYAMRRKTNGKYPRCFVWENESWSGRATRMPDCLARPRCPILGRTPATSTHLPCRRFWSRETTCRQAAICRAEPARASSYVPRTGLENRFPKHSRKPSSVKQDHLPEQGVLPAGQHD